MSLHIKLIKMFTLKIICEMIEFEKSFITET